MREKLLSPKLHFSRSKLTQNGDGGVEPALLVEEPRALHLGEGLVRVGVVGRPLDPRPVADGGGAPYQSILPDVDESREFSHEGLLSFSFFLKREN